MECLATGWLASLAETARATPQGKVPLSGTIPGVGYYELGFLECFCCVEKRLMGYWRKWKNFHILKNDPETSSIFSNNPLVSFRQSKNIRETLVHSNLHQESSPLSGTFPCRVAQCKTCKFIDSSTVISRAISRALPPISFTV